MYPTDDWFLSQISSICFLLGCSLGSSSEGCFGDIIHTFLLSIVALNVGGSSNGRTAGFGPVYWSSNLCPPAMISKFQS